MAGRIVSGTIRAVAGSRKPIKAALTLVSIKSKSIILTLEIYILLAIIYYVFLQTPSAVDQLKKILSGKSDCVSYVLIIYIFIVSIIFKLFKCYRLVLKLVLNNEDAMV